MGSSFSSFFRFSSCSRFSSISRSLWRFFSSISSSFLSFSLYSASISSRFSRAILSSSSFSINQTSVHLNLAFSYLEINNYTIIWRSNVYGLNYILKLNSSCFLLQYQYHRTIAFKNHWQYKFRSKTDSYVVSVLRLFSSVLLPVLQSTISLFYLPCVSPCAQPIVFSFLLPAFSQSQPACPAKYNSLP